MAGTMESLATINSVVRTLLALVVVAAVSAAGWLGFSSYQTSGRKEAALQEARLELTNLQGELDDQRAQLQARDQLIGEQTEKLAAKEQRIVQQGRRIGELEDDVEAKKKEIDRLDTSLSLLKVDHRVARLTVLEQGTDPESGDDYSLIEFAEIDQEGETIDEPRTFRIVGDIVYVDYWVAKFEEQYVETSDLERSTSIVMFRRIFGEFQEPMDGYQLDETGSRPTVYGRTRDEPSDLEKKIWGDFWAIANDPARAGELGIRAAHGEAVSIKVEAGRRYKLMLRASDGLSIAPDGRVPGRQ